MISPNVDNPEGWGTEHFRYHDNDVKNQFAHRLQSYGLNPRMSHSEVRKFLDETGYTSLQAMDEHRQRMGTNVSDWRQSAVGQQSWGRVPDSPFGGDHTATPGLSTAYNMGAFDDIKVEPIGKKNNGMNFFTGRNIQVKQKAPTAPKPNMQTVHPGAPQVARPQPKSAPAA